MASSADLRKLLRAKRRALPAELRDEFSARVCAHLLQSDVFRTCRRVATYVAMDSEVDLGPLVTLAWQQSKRVYLPAIIGFQNRLRFAPYARATVLKPNRFGIHEPVVMPDQLVGGMSLDVILMPLVGFDTTGTRLGMGGGFYDRSLAFRLHRTHWHKPQLIGVAFEVQKVQELVRNAWDVPLDNVLTERGFLW